MTNDQSYNGITEPPEARRVRDGRIADVALAAPQFPDREGGDEAHGYVCGNCGFQAAASLVKLPAPEGSGTFAGTCAAGARQLGERLRRIRAAVCPVCLEREFTATGFVWCRPCSAWHTNLDDVADHEDAAEESARDAADERRGDGELE